MSMLTEKTREYVLSACPNLECNVSTFIKQDDCPGCGATGVLLRHPDWDRGAPRDLRSGPPEEPT